ncbi:MAG: hypothetical protein LC808_36700 [Actinobacteria bacterium]|nr:hypothetical protein [Actinomycetota bacterium]
MATCRVIRANSLASLADRPRIASAVLPLPSDRQAARWGRNELVHVHRRPLRYPKDWPNTPAVEKGIDVQLAIDVVRLAIQGEYDAVRDWTDYTAIPSCAPARWR